MDEFIYIYLVFFVFMILLVYIFVCLRFLSNKFLSAFLLYVFVSRGRTREGLKSLFCARFSLEKRRSMHDNACTCNLMITSKKAYNDRNGLNGFNVGPPWETGVRKLAICDWHMSTTFECEGKGSENFRKGPNQIFHEE
jgi:hypothetical protein